MGMRQEMMREEINHLVKRAMKGRHFIQQMALEPNQRKEPMAFSANRAAAMLDKSTASVASVLRSLGLADGVDPAVGRFQIDETAYAALQKHYYPPRPSGPAKVLVVANQKGGVAKTTTVAHLVPWLAMHNLKVLLIDGDSQGSITAYQGVIPDFELNEEDTISPLLSGMQAEDGRELSLPEIMQKIIRKSAHIRNLSYIPACLELANGDVTAYQRQYNGEPGFSFYNRLYLGIEAVRNDYDVIVVDCPPHISPVTWNCVFAADMILVPTGAHMLDFASTLRFIDWMKTMVDTLPNTPLGKLCFLVTNYDSQGSSAENLEVIRSVLGNHLLSALALHSTEVQRASALFKSIYEVPRAIGHKTAFSRAGKAMDLVNREILANLDGVSAYTRNLLEGASA